MPPRYLMALKVLRDAALIGFLCLAAYMLGMELGAL